MSEEEPMKCARCGGEMKLGSIRSELRILKKNDLYGDKIDAFYCKDCGFIELYKEPSDKEPWRGQKEQQISPIKEPQQSEKEQPPVERKRLVR